MLQSGSSFVSQSNFFLDSPSYESQIAGDSNRTGSQKKSRRVILLMLLLERASGKEIGLPGQPLPCRICLNVREVG